MEKSVIGIDFGTSKCCVGVFRNGQVEVLENERGHTTTPSCVGFTEEETLIGENARDQLAINPLNTIFGIKRIIGKSSKEQTIQDNTNLFPFKLTHDNNRPRIKVKYHGKNKVFNPEQITALILSKLKEMAEFHLRCSVQKAVIAVPAIFSNSQRQAIKDAATMAGLEVLSIVNDTTASAIAYNHSRSNKKEKPKENLLIFDLGAGKLDVAIVEVQTGNVIKTKAINGNANLGGSDFDIALLKYLSQIVEKRFGIIDILGAMPKCVEKLRDACETSKCSLSGLKETLLEVENLQGQHDFSYPISRQTFERLATYSVMHKINQILNKVLIDSGLQQTNLDKILLVGGSTRIPLIRRLLSMALPGINVSEEVNLDEAVVTGTTLYAANMAGSDCAPSVSIADVLLKPCVSIPKSINYSKGVPIMSTDATLSSLNVLQSQLKSDRKPFIRVPPNVEIAMCYYERVDCTFTINNQVKKISYTKKKKEMILRRAGIFERKPFKNGKVKSLSECLSPKEIAESMKDLESIYSSNIMFKNRTIEMNKLESLCLSLRKEATQALASPRINEAHCDALIATCNNTLAWLDDNKNCTVDYYKMKRKKLGDMGNFFLFPKDLIGFHDIQRSESRSHLYGRQNIELNWGALAKCNSAVIQQLNAPSKCMKKTANKVSHCVLSKGSQENETHGEPLHSEECKSFTVSTTPQDTANNGKLGTIHPDDSHNPTTVSSLDPSIQTKILETNNEYNLDTEDAFMTKDAPNVAANEEVNNHTAGHLKSCMSKNLNEFSKSIVRNTTNKSVNTVSSCAYSISPQANEDTTLDSISSVDSGFIELSKEDINSLEMCSPNNVASISENREEISEEDSLSKQESIYQTSHYIENKRSSSKANDIGGALNYHDSPTLRQTHLSHHHRKTTINISHGDFPVPLKSPVVSTQGRQWASPKLQVKVANTVQDSSPKPCSVAWISQDPKFSLIGTGISTCDKINERHMESNGVANEHDCYKPSVKVTGVCDKDYNDCTGPNITMGTSDKEFDRYVETVSRSYENQDACEPLLLENRVSDFGTAKNGTARRESLGPMQMLSNSFNYFKEKMRSNHK